MSRLPHAKAKLTFLSRAEGGRKSTPPVDMLRSFQYRPHIVVGDPRQRERREDILSKAQLIREGDGEYLGVVFSDVDREPKEGEEMTVELVFMYFPQVTYRDAVPGATFTLREGARIVGFGEILEVNEKEVGKANQPTEPTAKSATHQ